MIHAHFPEIEIHGIRVGLVLGAPGFGGDQLRTHLIGEMGDNFILHVEHIGHRLVEPVRP